MIVFSVWRDWYVVLEESIFWMLGNICVFLLFMSVLEIMYLMFLFMVVIRLINGCINGEFKGYNICNIIKEIILVVVKRMVEVMFLMERVVVFIKLVIIVIFIIICLDMVVVIGCGVVLGIVIYGE